jgi:hypothetical protein
MALNEVRLRAPGGAPPSPPSVRIIDSTAYGRAQWLLDFPEVANMVHEQIVSPRPLNTLGGRLGTSRSDHAHNSSQTMSLAKRHSNWRSNAAEAAGTSPML